MILGVLLGLAAMAVLVSVLNGRETETIALSKDDSEFFILGDYRINRPEDESRDALASRADRNSMIIAAGLFGQETVTDRLTTQEQEQPAGGALSSVSGEETADTDDAINQASDDRGETANLVRPGRAVTLSKGLDNFILGALTGGSGPATIKGFSRNEDALICAFNAKSELPTVSLEFTKDQFGKPKVARLLANGELVAIVEGLNGAIGLEDVFLAPMDLPV